MKTIKPTGRRSLVSVDEAIRRVEAAEQPVKTAEKLTPHDEDFFYFGHFYVNYDHPMVVIEPDEEYQDLIIDKQPAKSPQNDLLLVEPYTAIIEMERRGMFLPSLPLTCYILRAVADMNREKIDSQRINFLSQYGKMGVKESAMYVQNTIVDFQNGIVSHYPLTSDFVQKGPVGNTKRESYQRSFHREGLKSGRIKDLVADETRIFIDALTGLNDIMFLSAMGDYFGKPASLVLPENPGDSKYALFFGGGKQNFVIDASIPFDEKGSTRGIAYARGVAEKKEYDEIN